MVKYFPSEIKSVNFPQYKKYCVVSYNLTLLIGASPLGLWDSLNIITIFTQAPYSPAAYLVIK